MEKPDRFDRILPRTLQINGRASNVEATDRLMQVPRGAGVRSMVCLEEIKPSSPLPLAD